MIKPATKKPPLAPLESSEEEKELASKRVKKKKQMSQSAKAKALTDYKDTPIFSKISV